METIIIEDEKPAARLLQRKLEKLGITAGTMLHSVAEATEWFKSNPHPELIFLDIQLSDGLSFEIFENVSIKSAIIFTTAYDEYALKAFKLNSIDYLLKPIDEDDLAVAVSKFRERANEARPSFDMSQIRRMFSAEQSFRERFTIRIGQSLKVVTIDQVECFFSENKGTYIHTSDGRDYPIDSTLEILETELDPKKFFRISRKFIIPLKAIREIQVHSNSRLKIILPSYSGDEVIVSREKVAAFKHWLG